MLINLQRKCCDCPCSLSTEDNKIFSLCPQLCDVDDVFQGYYYVDKELECGCDDPFLTYQFECVDCSYCNEEEEVEVVTLCPCGDPDYGFPCCKDPEGFAPPNISTDDSTDTPTITQINPYAYPRVKNTYNVYDTDGNIVKTCLNDYCTFYIENGTLLYSSIAQEAKTEKCGCCCMLTDTQGNKVIAEPKCPKLCLNAPKDPTDVEDYVYYVNADFECCQGVLKAGCYANCEDGSLPKNYCKCCDEQSGEYWGPCCGPTQPPQTDEGGGDDDWPGKDQGCSFCWWEQVCTNFHNTCPYPDPYDNSVCVDTELKDPSSFRCQCVPGNTNCNNGNGGCPNGFTLQTQNVIFCTQDPNNPCDCVVIALTDWGCYFECEQCYQFTTCTDYTNYVNGCASEGNEIPEMFECEITPPCSEWPDNCDTLPSTP